MSHYVTDGNKSYVCGSTALTAGQIVKLGSGADAGKIVPAAAATDISIGVVNAAVKVGWQTDVRLRSCEGTLSVVAGGTIAVGDAVTSNASGAGITTTTAGNQILGYALEAGTTGSFVEVMPAVAKY